MTRELAPLQHGYYLAMAAVIAGIAFVGFAPSYYLSSLFEPRHWPPLVHVHATLFTAWVCLLLFQATLIRTGSVRLHRRVGLFGCVLAVAMVGVGTQTAIAAARRGLAPDGMDPLAFLVVPLGALAVFAVLLAAAIASRHRPESHKRLMLLATFAILTPALARLPGVGQRPAVALALTVILVLVLAARDWRVCGRVHPVTAWGGGLLLVSAPLRFLIGHTEAWHRLATHLAG